MTSNKHSRRTPSATDIQPHVELFLAGDFKSPAEVLAADRLSPAQKREILEFWRDDLREKVHLPEVRVLLASIGEALAQLGDT